MQKRTNPGFWLALVLTGVLSGDAEKLATPIHHDLEGIRSGRSDRSLVHRRANLHALVRKDEIVLGPCDPVRGNWKLLLKLDSPLAGDIRREGRRILSDRGRIIELLEEKDRGIEHSFLVQHGSPSVSIEISSRGITRVVDAGGRLDFFGPAGLLMSYGKLAVFDATGRRLAAEMSWDGASIHLDVLETGAYPIYVDPLATTPDWSNEGNLADARYGRSVSSAGDVNGDGFDDLLIGASNYAGTGRVYVYHGGPAGVSATPDWQMDGSQVAEFFGVCAAPAGDVNGDGYDDIIVGSAQYDGGQNNEGRAMVYHGGPSGLSGTPNWSAEPDVVNARFGNCVAPAGDVNGDGYDDVAIGARLYANGQNNEGAAYVFLGGPAGLQATPVWQQESNQAGAQYGVRVATAGDVNNDGFDDLLVGAARWDNGQADEGGVWLYYGGASGPSATANWSAEGDQIQAFFGADVSPAGDVNGDGIDDFLIGASRWDGPDVDEGRVFVYHGSNTGPASVPDRILEIDQAGARLGARVWSAGDVDGDGFDDVIVGASRFTNGQTEEGAAFVHLGSASGLQSTAAWTTESDQADARYGVDVATAGDVNGDGAADVVVGAHFYDNPDANEGRAYVFHGTPPAGTGTGSTTGTTTTTGTGTGTGGGGGSVVSGSTKEKREAVCSAGSTVSTPPFLLLIAVLLLGVPGRLLRRWRRSRGSGL